MGTLRGQSGADRLLIVAAAVVVIAAGMRWGADLLLPLIFILYTTSLVAPLFEWLQNRGLPKWLAVILLILLLVGVFAGLFLLVFFSFNRLRISLGATENALLTQLEALGLGGQSGSISETELTNTVNQFMDVARGILTGFLGNIVGIVASALIVLVGVVLILLDLESLGPRISAILKRGDSNLDNVRRLPGNLVSYFVARTQINLITGTMVFLFLLVMRVPFAPLWGVLAFFLSYIPYIGITVAAIPAVVLAFANGGLVPALIVIAGYVVLNQVAEAILEPKITGARLSLRPWFVFLAMFSFGWLMGPAGVFLAGPLTIFLVIFASLFDETQWMLELVLADQPAPEKE